MTTSHPGSRGTRRALSLLELLIATTILLLVLVPVIELLAVSHRQSISARKMLDATAFAQTLLDAVVQLEAAELPPVAAGSRILVSDDLDDRTLPQGPRWQQIRAYSKNRRPAAVSSWVLSMERLSPRTVAFRVDVTWYPPAGESGGPIARSLHALSYPR